MKCKIKRLVRAGLKNETGKIFEVKSTNAALNEYIGKPIILINKGDDYLSHILPNDKVVGYFSDYNDSYIICELYKDMLPNDFYSTDYMASLSVTAEETDSPVLYNITKIRKIVIWKN